VRLTIRFTKSSLITLASGGYRNTMLGSHLQDVKETVGVGEPMHIVSPSRR